ncbi:MAG: hypothetical protein J6K45_07570 [Clostridia bacterium]|nr:hypothetical protein [Clostridia bacterium]
MGNSYLEMINPKEKNEIADIKKCNEYISQYGLILSDNQIKSILEKRREILKETGRIELRKGILDKLIKEFCDSPYMNQENFVQNLYELIEIFYEYKNETMDLLTDDELLDFMKKSFDETAKGDLEYLSGTIMYKMRENLLKGKPLDYNEKECEEDE